MTKFSTLKSGAPRHVLPAVFAISTLILPLGACSLVPRDGPSARGVTAPAEDKQHPAPYALVDVTKPVADKVQAFHAQVAPESFATLPPAKPFGTLGAGDTLRITIWEATPQGGGVFTQGHGADVAAAVGQDGDISVPYAGRFNVLGLSPAQIENEIVRRLTGRVYSPQVSVQLSGNVANTVFVEGEILRPGRLPLTPGGDHLLDLVTLAGGPHLQPHETMVRVTRDGQTAAVDLDRIVSDPALNIVLSPGDTVSLTRRIEMFYAFGALNHEGQVPFSEHTATLLQALGAIAGLQDARADPKGVFVFRREPVALTASLTANAPPAQNGFVPVVYRINLEDPNSFFVLGSFPVQPMDIVFVSNAPLLEYQKIVDSFIGSTGDLLNTGLAAATLTK